MDTRLDTPPSSDRRHLNSRIALNDLGRMSPGSALYTSLCNARGGLVDDLTVFCLGASHYWLCPTPSRVSVVRGETMGGVVPTFADRLEAAKAATPYFAPKLSSIDVVAEHRNDVSQFTDDELYAIIAGTPEGQATLAARNGHEPDGVNAPDWVRVASKLRS